MRDIAIAAFIFGSLPFILTRPWIGMLMYAWLSLMVPYRFAFGFAYDFPFVYLVAICTLLGMLLAKDQVRYPTSTIMVLLLIFPLWTCVTYLFSFEPEGGYRRLVEVLKVFLFVHVCAMVLRTREQIHWMLWVIVVSVGFFGVKGGVFTIATGGSSRVWGPPGATYLTDNNSIGVALIMVVPLMQYLRGVSSSTWARHGLLGAMLLSGMAILGTYSRGSLLAVGVMLLFLWLKGKHKLLYAVLFAVIVPVGIGFMPERWGERMGTIQTYEQDSSAMGRINAWQMAINVANDRPLVGGGFELYTARTFARYAPVPDAVHSAHSVYFQMLGEHGYVGLLLFLSIGISAWIAARRTSALARQREDLAWAAQLARAIQVSLIGFAVGGAFVNIGYWDLIYYLIVIIVLVRKLASEQTAVPAPAEGVAKVQLAGRR